MSKSNKKVTIKDVAKAANVSISTVSYALNDSGSVSPETREKIIEVAEALNYRPNAFARGLKSQKSYMIGIFLDNFDGPIYSEIIRGIQEVLKPHQYELIVAEYVSGSRGVSRVFEEKIVDGAIVLSTGISNQTVEDYASSDFPIVLLDRKLQGEYIANVLIDNTTASYQLIHFIAQQGHEKIALIRGPQDSFDGDERYQGAMTALEAHQLTLFNNQAYIGDFTEESGYAITQEILKCEEKPDVIVAANDEMAIGVLKALKAAHVSVPEDISVTGFDDIELSRYVTPKLTTVHRPKYELGLLAAHEMISLLKGNKASHQQVLGTHLKIRGSLKLKER